MTLGNLEQDEDVHFQFQFQRERKRCLKVKKTISKRNLSRHTLDFLIDTHFHGFLTNLSDEPGIGNQRSNKRNNYQGQGDLGG